MNIERYIRNEYKDNAEFMKLFLKIEPNLSFQEYIDEKKSREESLQRQIDFGYIEEEYYLEHAPEVLKEREYDALADEIESELADF